MSLGSKYKDPSAILDYQIDWSIWLGANDTLQTVTWEISSGLVKDSESNTSTTATIWLSGGTLNQFYTITCSIITAQGRYDQRSFVLRIKDL